MTIKQANITINVKDMYKSIAFYESIGLVVKAGGTIIMHSLLPRYCDSIHPAKRQYYKRKFGKHLHWVYCR